MNHDMEQAEDRTQHENAYSESGTSPPQPPTELIARLYHAHHLVPVPLHPFEKKPMIKGWADATARLPPDVAKSFEHHAASLSVTPLELVEMSVRMVVDPYRFLAVCKHLTESEAERARREPSTGEWRRLPSARSSAAGEKSAPDGE